MTNQTSASQENSGFFEGFTFRHIFNGVSIIAALAVVLTYFNSIVEGSTRNIKENINDVKSNVEDVQDDVKDLLVVTTENKTTLEHLKQVDSKN